MTKVVPPDPVDLLYHLLLPLPQNIRHVINIHDAFQPMLQTAVNLNEFQYETLLLASGVMQSYGGNTTFSRRHLESLKIQLQENTEIYFTSPKLERNGRSYYFISLDRPRYPNLRLQVNYNNNHLLRPRARHLAPHRHHIIERLCHERHEAENVQPRKAL
jgi:hypothetical protein